MVHMFFEKKKTGSRVSVNKLLAQKLHKPVIQRLKRKRFYVIL